MEMKELVTEGDRVTRAFGRERSNKINQVDHDTG